MKSRSSALINAVSSTVFGIYLIHDNNYLRPVLWEDILHVKDFRESPYLILYQLVCIVLVFSVCAVMELIRQKLIEKPVLHLIDPFLKWLNSKTHIINETEPQVK